MRPNAYLKDPPRTLEDLQSRALTPENGYDVHHVVEQTSARFDGFPESMIESSANRVLVPRYQHERISAWFATKKTSMEACRRGNI